MEILRKYGESTTVLFPLIDAGAADFEDTPVTFATGDTKICKDEGTFANATNDPAHEGNGIYSLVLTATEMEAARIVIVVIDQTATKEWEDQAVLIGTYGSASGQHAFDLDTAVQDVIATNIHGPGAIEFTYTVTSTVDATAVEGVHVWVSSDVGGANVVASGYTDSSGEVVFYLDAGTWYVWRQKSGWDFPNPDTEVVS